MGDKSNVMAAIAAAIGMYEEEEARAAAVTPRPQVTTSNWKYWGVGEMMRMRTMWQLRMCAPASIKRR
jgi:hypothetical protein